MVVFVSVVRKGVSVVLPSTAGAGLMLNIRAGTSDKSRPLTGLAKPLLQPIEARHKAANRKMCFSFVFIAKKIVAPPSGFFHFTPQTYGKGIYLAIHRTKLSINIFLGNYLV